MKEEILPVNGMHCASCSSIIKKRISKLPGVEKCDVNYATEKAMLTYDPAKVSIHSMNELIKPIGYSLQEEKNNGQMMGMDHSTHTGIGQSKEQKLQELSVLTQKVQLAFPLALFSFTIMIWHGLSQINLVPHFFVAMNILNVFQFIIASIVLFGTGQIYIQALLRFIQYRVANMETLVGLGIVSAYIYSSTMLLFPQIANLLNISEGLYFEATIVVTGFMLFGDYLVAKSKIQTGTALEKLIGLQAKTVLVLVDGKEVEMHIEALKVDDIFVVKPGSNIAVDGIILEGSSSIDESMITGESMPVDKKTGDVVVGSTINKYGFLTIKATKIGNDTMLARIIAMVEKAQGSRASVQNLADKIVEYFVPAVLVIAILSFVTWTFFGRVHIGFSTFIAVLVVACPCAMGLATPVAIIVAVGKAAEQGILIKNAESLQKLTTVTHILFDKTGTITNGMPVVSKIEEKEEHAFSLLASLESKSEHPLSSAVTNYAKTKNILIKNVSDFSVIEGKGLQGVIDGERYFAGSISFLKEKNILLDNDLIQTFLDDAQTPIIFANNHKALVYVGIKDTIKDGVKELIATLRQMSITTGMVSGDNKIVAHVIAKEAGIDMVFAEVLPADKAHIIKNLQKNGNTVAFCGDGVNDAPALSTANVGIAMGTGSDAAIESADITLLGGNITKVATALKLAKSTFTTIKQNLFFAFFYNALAIPVAAGALYPIFAILLSPAIEGAAMAFSSVSVVVNSLRLKSQKL
jgi:P-type Cu+ transporter